MDATQSPDQAPAPDATQPPEPATEQPESPEEAAPPDLTQGYTLCLDVRPDGLSFHVEPLESYQQEQAESGEPAAPEGGAMGEAGGAEGMGEEAQPAEAQAPSEASTPVEDIEQGLKAIFKFYREHPVGSDEEGAMEAAYGRKPKGRIA